MFFHYGYGTGHHELFCLFLGHHLALVFLIVTAILDGLADV